MQFAAQNRQFFGDWDDLVPEDEEQPVEERDYIPAEVDWFDFLVHMNWTDEILLNRQSALWVHRNWRVYLYQIQVGLLTKGIL